MKKKLIIFALVVLLFVFLFGISLTYYKSTPEYIATLCEEEGCSRKKIDGELFCEEHRLCKVEACPNLRLEVFHYCEEHKCSISACDNPKVKNGEYCESHTCNIDECYKYTSDEYCPYHQAQIGDRGTRKEFAWTCAKDIVLSSLKSPSTAEFCSYSEANILYNGGTAYTVYGYVDAQNSFGAMLRSNFTVTLTLTEQGYKNGSVDIY